MRLIFMGHSGDREQLRELRRGIAVNSFYPQAPAEGLASSFCARTFVQCILGRMTLATSTLRSHNPNSTCPRRVEVGTWDREDRSGVLLREEETR